MTSLETYQTVKFYKCFPFNDLQCLTNYLPLIVERFKVILNYVTYPICFVIKSFQAPYFLLFKVVAQF